MMMITFWKKFLTIFILLACPRPIHSQVLISNEIIPQGQESPDTMIYKELRDRLAMVDKKDQEAVKKITEYPNFASIVSQRFSTVIGQDTDLGQIKEAIEIINSTSGDVITSYCQFLKTAKFDFLKAAKFNGKNDQYSSHYFKLLDTCTNGIYFKPYKMAELVEFSSETSNLVLKETKNKRQVVLQMNIRNGVKRQNGDIELTSIIVRATLDVKYLYKSKDKSLRYSYKILEWARKLVFESSIRRGLTEKEYRQVYSVLYNRIIQEAVRHLDTPLKFWSPLNWEFYRNRSLNLLLGKSIPNCPWNLCAQRPDVDFYNYFDDTRSIDQWLFDKEKEEFEKKMIQID